MSFSNLEQAIGGTEAVFDQNADQIAAWAKDAATNFGLSEAEARTATTSIGGQLKRMTDDLDFATEHSKELVGVAADLAATYGGTTAEAVQALGAAFRGEADPAERFNLNLKISEVNAKAVELGLAETTSSVDDNAKAQATLALILEQSSDAQGQFAREADTVSGQMQRLNARLEDSKAAFGEAFAPAVTDGTGFLITLLDALAAAETKWQEFGSAVSSGAKSFREMMGWEDDLWKHIDEVARANGDVAEAMAEAEAAAGPLTSQTAELSQEMDIARHHTTGAAAATRELTDAQLAAADPVFALLDAMSNYEAALSAVQEDGKITADEQFRLAEAALEASAAFRAIDTESAQSAISALSEVLGISEGDVRGLLRELGVFADEADGISHAITDGLVLGLNGLGAKVSAKLSSETALAIRNFKDELGIGSPSKVFADEFGVPISEGVAEGILEGMDAAKSALQELSDELRDQATSNLGDILGAMQGVLSNQGAQARLQKLREEGAPAEEIAAAELAVLQSHVRLVQQGRALGQMTGGSEGLLAMLAGQAGLDGGGQQRIIDLVRSAMHTAALTPFLSLFADIPGFDAGGIVPGPRGSNQLIMAHGGETVLPTHNGGGTETINIILDGAVVASAVRKRFVRDNKGGRSWL
jgi:hypothetical protein